MVLKYKVVLWLFALSLIFGFGGYFINFVYAILLGIILFVICLSTLQFSESRDKSVVSILVDGILFGLI